MHLSGFTAQVCVLKVGWVANSRRGFAVEARPSAGVLGANKAAGVLLKLEPAAFMREAHVLWK